MNIIYLKEVLKKHQMWLQVAPEGERANLQGAILDGANLQGANLWGANLQGAILQGAILQGANLRGANLEGANLRGANLYGANLRGAYLEGANLWGANLDGANLQGANLQGANLQGANLQGANLQGANLWGANLWGVDLQDANLRGASLPPWSIVPEEGSFIGYKKCSNGNILRLRIPADASRINAIGSRKCRASYVWVLDYHLKISDTENVGTHHGRLTYRVGEMVECDMWDGDPRKECTGGIHFFITAKETEDW
jgi:hypothetical protein